MNDSPHPQPWNDPALEARIVAAVLGECSAFEAAEIERLIAEHPELALFQQRIAATHRLLQQAAQPETLRLAPERRRHLLEKIGIPAEPKTPAVRALPSPSWWASPAFLQIAASLLLVAVVLTVFSHVRVYSGSAEAPVFEGASNESGSFAFSVLEETKVDRPATVAAAPALPAGLPQVTMAPVTAPAKQAPAIAGVTGGDRSESAAGGKPVDLVSAPVVTTRSGLREDVRVVTEFPTPQVPQGAVVTSAAPAPQEGWDSLYMYRGVNVLEKPQSETGQASKTKVVTEADTVSEQAAVGSSPGQSQGTASGAGLALSANAVGVPAFGEDAKGVKFDGFINYGAPIEVPVSEGQTRQQVDDLVREGKDDQASGRNDLADKRFAQALVMDGASSEAPRGREEIAAVREEAKGVAAESSQRMLFSADAAWEKPVRQFQAGSSVISPDGETSKDANSNAASKMAQIILPTVELNDVTVREAIDTLKKHAAEEDATEVDPAKKGVNIAKNFSESEGPETRLTMSLKDVPLAEAIQLVADSAGLKVEIDSGVVVLKPNATATSALVTKEYRVEPGFLPDFPGSSGSPSREQVKKHLEANGVPFPAGSFVEYFPNAKKLVVRNTEASLELIDTVVSVAGPANPAPQPTETAAAKEPFSTFSLHVSDVSFQLAREALARGQSPDPSRIRAEEFYNAFDYQDPAPTGKVACRIEQSAHPLLQQRNLVRIAVRAAASGRAASQPLRLTILLDTSGSMERDDRAAAVRQALQTLAGLLGPSDRVTLIGFARTPRLLVDQLPGDQAEKLLEAARRTPSDGGTNLEAALTLGIELAAKHKLDGAQNRIVLLTDGAANLGDADPARLAGLVDRARQHGLSFDACGVGSRGLNDEVLETLTRRGVGRYYFLENPEDADAAFARQLAGAFRPAAENVKVQVQFHPGRVGRYRLIGFDQHRLDKEDFRNDRVQAAELSAEEAGVALYQVEVLPEGEGDVGTVFVRFRDPSTGRMVEQAWPIPYQPKAPAFDQAPPALQLAGVAALLAERLQGNDQIDLEALRPVVLSLRARFPNQPRVEELVRMFDQLRR